MSKPAPIRPLSGFPEYLPEHKLIEQQVLDTLRRTFELHGFAQIGTRAVEPMAQLLRKGDTSKEVYVLRRLHDAEAEVTEDALGLHFDLTVPFARYVLENAGKLEFPFRRYQIQPVWRGERPQEGRYREFVQADIDIVGREELGFHHDIEVARVMLQALGGLDFLPGFRLQVNNRKLLTGFYAGLGLDETGAEETMRLIDKLDKLPVEKVRELLLDESQGAGVTADQADKALALAQIRSADTSFVDQVRALGVEHPLLSEGLDELAALLEGCADLARPSEADGARIRIEADLMIARGLDYYTGTVFETRMDGYESLGSICSGGRYDSLASDGKTSYPGVGISLGVTRLLAPLIARGVLTGGRKVPSRVLVALTDEESRGRSTAVADALRARGIACEVAPSAAKFGKQIRYAERRGITYVWFCQPEGPDQVKNIDTGEQVDADPAAWTPADISLKENP